MYIKGSLYSFLLVMSKIFSTKEIERNLKEYYFIESVC